jgi:hypothetical protein
MKSFFENFYGTLFCPSKTFDEMAETPVFIQGLLTIIIISALKPMTDYSIQINSQEIAWLALKIFFSAFGAISLWLLVAVLIQIAAKFFDRESKIKNILTLTAFSLLPQIFIAPIELLKNGGSGGYLLGVLLGIAVQIWTIYLLFLAVTKVYNVTTAKALALSTIPLLGSILFFNWTINFFSSLYTVFRL